MAIINRLSTKSSFSDIFCAQNGLIRFRLSCSTNMTCNIMFLRVGNNSWNPILYYLLLFSCAFKGFSTINSIFRAGERESGRARARARARGGGGGGGGESGRSGFTKHRSVVQKNRPIVQSSKFPQEMAITLITFENI